MSDYDLTKLDRPLGEYPDAVIGAMFRASWGTPNRLEVRASGAWINCKSAGSSLGLPGTYRLAPEPLRPMSPPWDVLPEWAVAVAMDEGGSVYAYDAVPECGKHTLWIHQGNRCLYITYLRFDRGNMPWNESLVLRPGGNHE